MVKSIIKRFRQDERGALAVLFGVASPIIIGAAGYGAEVAYWQHSVRTLQNAADAGAYSGAGQLTQGRSASEVAAAAAAMAAASGFDASEGTVTTHAPPISGAFAGDADAVEVVVRQSVPRLFTALFVDTGDLTVEQRSVARAAGNRPSCVLALDTSASPAVSFSGSTDVILQGCDIAANSVATTAMQFNGSANVEADCVSAAGGIDNSSGNLTLTDCARVFENSRVTPDPFADVAWPDPGGCDNVLKNVLKGLKNVSNVTLSPGLVCNQDLTLRGDIHFLPGTYYFRNSDLQFTAQANVTGTDVTFVLLGDTEVDMNGGPDIQLSAPTDASNPLRGMLFMSDASASRREHTFLGNSGNSFNGAVYLPNADITFSGNSTASTGVCTLLVANTVEFTGSSYLNSDCTALGLASPETSQIVLIVE